MTLPSRASLESGRVIPAIIDSSSQGLSRVDLPAWRDAVRAQGEQELAIHRAAYACIEDRGLRRFWERSAQAGIHRAIYLVWSWRTSAERQLECWLGILDSLSDPICWLDLEGDNLPKTRRTQAFADILALHRGIGKPGCYTSARWWCDVLGDPPAPELAASQLWLADYVPPYPVPRPWDRGLLPRVCWRGRARSTVGWSLWQQIGNLRPRRGPLKGCCVDVSVKA